VVRFEPFNNIVESESKRAAAVYDAQLQEMAGPTPDGEVKIDPADLTVPDDLDSGCRFSSIRRPFRRVSEKSARSVTKRTQFSWMKGSWR